MATTPYIGITDFMNLQQVANMLGFFETNRPPGSKRILHVGVMMSYKTLNDLPSRWKNAFPPKEEIGNIFLCDEAYNCLHYADYDNNPGLTENLVKAISFGDIGIHAMQLDMTWSDPAEIANAVHISRKNIEIILQIGGKALEQVGNDPAALVAKLADYDGVIARVLLDKSAGKGQGMDAVGLLPFARAIRDTFPDLDISAAGGLGPNTMHLVEPLLEEFPDISIDAQGKLRSSGSNLDPIDWDLAEKYLIEALKLVG